MHSMNIVAQPLPSQHLGNSPHPPKRFYQHNIASGVSSPGYNSACQMFAEIIEQPVSDGARFRYKCEGRSAGCIRGVNSAEKQKTYPTIQVHGYQGAAGVVVSCVTKDGPPYYPHPHNLVGKTCTNGVCYKPINNPEMICSFSNLGIQCVKRRDIKESLSQREALQVDPFGTGFSHNSEPNKINLNALRLCFQVFIPDSNGKLCVPLPPVISTPIFDNKTVSDLTITKLSHCSASVTGGQEVILLCDQINKDDIQIIFYEEHNKEISWSAFGKFSPHHVHRKAAISFQTPAYKNVNIQHRVDCFVHLRRPSDGTVGKPRVFTFLPLIKDPEGIAGKRKKYEALRLDRVLQLGNLPIESMVDLNAYPRIIKQAVRPKVSYQNSASNHFQPAHSDYPQPATGSSMLGNMTYNENLSSPPSYNHHKSVPQPNVISTTISQNSHRKVDDILIVASEQIGLNAAQNFCEMPVDDTLRLSSLDLGLNSSDLNLSGIGLNSGDVNLSAITLDSFSDSAGLNISLSLGDGKNSEVMFQDNSEMDVRSNCT